ncbi:unnamed protein product, partial [Iphiclides podalirius]
MESKRKSTIQIEALHFAEPKTYNVFSQARRPQKPYGRRHCKRGCILFIVFDGKQQLPGASTSTEFDMPIIVFKYFRVKALGEGGRMLLAYGGQEFVDHRVSDQEWPTLKPTTPFGQLPVLEVDGKQYAQSMAIYRYLGRRFGLAGDDVEEEYLIDQAVEFYNELRLKASAVYHESDKIIKAKMHDDLMKNYYPFMLKKLDDVMSENNGYLAAGKLTWADFLFAGMYDCLKMVLKLPDLDVRYPSFKNLHRRVLSLPGVDEYCKKAPHSEF